MAAIELGIPYYFWNPLSTQKFALNASSDPDFVGYVTDITGLDDSEVRENSSYVPAGHGGYNGKFWRGRKPFTFTGIIMPTMPTSSRSAAQEKIEAVLDQCLQGNGGLLWTPSDGVQRMLNFRKQQPARITRGQSNTQRNFMIACVAADGRVLSASSTSVSGQSASPVTTASAVNSGTVDSEPLFWIDGPITSPVITNLVSGRKITINTVVSAGVRLTIDMTGVYPTAINGTTNVYGSIDPLNTNWDIAVNPGSQTFQMTGAGTTSATKLTVTWRHSWP